MRDGQTLDQPCAVVAIGQLVVDLVVRVQDADLERLGLVKGRWQSIDKPRLDQVLAELDAKPEVIAGGSAANTLVSLSHLGVRTRLIGALGSGPRAALFMDSLAMPDGAVGVVQTRLLHRDKPTGVVLCLVTPDAERTMLALAGASLDMTASDLAPDMFAGAQFVHLTGYLVQMDGGELLDRAADLAHEAGARVSFDLASTPLVEAHHAFFDRFTHEQVDVLMANEQEINALVGDTQAALREMAREDRSMIVKLGAQGALIADGPSAVRPVSAEKANAVDTTGAGDAFAAGFLFGAVYRLPPIACTRVGAALAARMVEASGARIPLDQWPELARGLRGLAARLTKAQRSLDGA